MSARLGVNIDHVATLRQARGEAYPSVVDAAQVVLEAGAEQITIHLREDRRHIQDYDVPAVKLVTERYGVPLNLEMGNNEEILDVAINVKPEWICLVPEKREERTTEGGLNLKDKNQYEKVHQLCTKIRKYLPETKISLFVEADTDILQKCVELNVDAVEIHTGDYAMAFNRGEATDSFLKNYTDAYKLIKAAGMGFHAGHGITLENLGPLVKQNLFEEYNIGHWIICQSVFDGLANTVSKLKASLN